MTTSATGQLQLQLEDASTQYRQIQKSMIETRQRLDTQLQENKLVLEELSTIDNDDDEAAAVYKLIGPALIKQDKAEASSNVEKRLEFIEAEVKRSESKLQAVSTASEKKKMEIIDLQTRLQEIHTAS